MTEMPKFKNRYCSEIKNRRFLVSANNNAIFAQQSISENTEILYYSVCE